MGYDEINKQNNFSPGVGVGKLQPAGQIQAAVSIKTVLI